MGKLILVTDKGKEKIICKDVPDDIICVRAFTKEMVREALTIEGFAGSAKEVRIVANTALKNTLGYITCEDREQVVQAIRDAQLSGRLKLTSEGQVLEQCGCEIIRCRNCEHFDEDGSFCWHYGERVSPGNEAEECGHYYNCDQLYVACDADTVDLPIICEEENETDAQKIIEFAKKRFPNIREDIEELEAESEELGKELVLAHIHIC